MLEFFFEFLKKHLKVSKYFTETLTKCNRNIKKIYLKKFPILKIVLKF